LPETMNATLVLENGQVYTGQAFGAQTDVVFELVFNTSMTGYQEIISDPSYRGQGVLLTVPQVGNVGINDDDNEADVPQVSALVIRALSPNVSNWRSSTDLSGWLKMHGVPGISGVDTRAITRSLRDIGTLKAALSTSGTSAEVLLQMAREWPGLDGRDMVKEVTSTKAYHWSGDGGDKWVQKAADIPAGERKSVVLIDYGAKRNILRHLTAWGADVTVVPADTSAKTIFELKPDGVMLSNGPGDPAGLPYAVETVRELIESGLPIFGICLGHQLIGRALGGNTARLKFGHHGGNHPVQDVSTGKVYITAQNHNYMVMPDSLDPNEVQVTHLSLNDGSLEGFRMKHRPVYCVQFHPEGAPGPHDAHEIFEPFFAQIWNRVNDAQPAARTQGHLPEHLTILIPGSGPIVIGQAAEFDYSGTQAIKALRKLGHRVVLVNSNPATIMTDPEIADATYIEPLTVEALEAIIAQERPDVMLPTVGGQTGLNLAAQLSESGVLEKYGVRLIGASLTAIHTAEDRLLFRQAMLKHGLPLAEGGPAYNLAEAESLALMTGYPLLVRASFAMGGSGASWVYKPDELPEAVRKAIAASPIQQAWLEESVMGWKEYELEVMRDAADNFVVVCSIENFDPMGIHTGDSITVAPAQTLTDREYQIMRDLARQVMSAVGVETGGANVQFAVNPQDGRILIIEMNPRVSRSSALASKATGFPIAKIAAQVAAGLTLDQIMNDITGVTKAAFEPSIDYVVVKIPRWTFEKFPGVDAVLGPQMKSVGEVLALGRTFPEALQKAVQSLEIGVDALDGSGARREAVPVPGLDELKVPVAERLFMTYQALASGLKLEDVSAVTGFDPWFLSQLVLIENQKLKIQNLAGSLEDPSQATILEENLRIAKQLGFADSYLARLLSTPAARLFSLDIRNLRKKLGILATFLRVDTCAAEFKSQTPYLYSSYEREDEARPTGREKILILGGGPNRIGQGIEFDYCCCQAAFALRDQGYETIMLNCNPETVSTDYDTADRLYFEPLTLEHVLNVVDCEKVKGVIVQFGGQTPLNLAAALQAAGVPIIGTSPESIALAEDRQQFASLLAGLDIPQPENGMAISLEEARIVANKIGYPVLVRPSFVLGGRAMAIAGSEDELAAVVAAALKAAPGRPILIDRFLDDSFEMDVDALVDEERVVVGAIMEHVEQAGIHSGDSACVLPPYKISAYHLGILRDYTEQLGRALNVRGLMNVQFALKDDIVYVLEVNPRASRTIPFVSKATGLPMARLAAQIMVGRSLAEMGVMEEPKVDGFFVKEAVMPFNKLPGADPRLGPEMRSTGEVMGIASHFGHAFAKSQLAAGSALPVAGNVLISVNDFDKGAALKIARDLVRLGFNIYATPGTARFFNGANVPAVSINPMYLGSPHTVELIRAGTVQLIINTPYGSKTHTDGEEIRASAIQMNIPLLTTLTAAMAAVAGIRALKEKDLSYTSLQSHYAKRAK